MVKLSILDNGVIEIALPLKLTEEDVYVALLKIMIYGDYISGKSGNLRKSGKWRDWRN